MATRKRVKAIKGAYVGHCPACLCGQMLEVSKIALDEKERAGSISPLSYSVEYGLLSARLAAVNETQGYTLCGFHAGTSKTRGK